MSDRNGQTRVGTGRGANFKSLVDRREAGPRLNVILGTTQEVMGNALHAVLMGGMGVLIAPTSDKGAISVTLYDGDERLRSYASSPDEWKAILSALTDAGDAAATFPLPDAQTRRNRS